MGSFGRFSFAATRFHILSSFGWFDVFGYLDFLIELTRAIS